MIGNGLKSEGKFNIFKRGTSRAWAQVGVLCALEKGNFGVPRLRNFGQYPALARLSSHLCRVIPANAGLYQSKNPVISIEGRNLLFVWRREQQISPFGRNDSVGGERDGSLRQRRR